MAAEETRKPRRQAPFLAGVVLILAALPLGWLLFLREPPPAPSPPPPTVAPTPVPLAEEARPAALELSISQVKGTVEVRQGEGGWVPARAGTPLRASDTVRTRGGSYAVLIGGEAVEVRMEPGTEVSVAELTSSLSSLSLGNGMATVVVRRGKGRAFELRAAGSDARARTEEATFTMSNDGQGTVAVGTREGEVSFEGQGKVVIVRAGQQSLVLPGQAPSRPSPLPSSLLLKVQWPAGLTTRGRKLVVAGQTDPGSRLELDGESFSPQPDGRFSRTVTLKEGRNSLRVRTVSLGGSELEETRDIRLDTTPPALDLDPGIWK